MTQRFERLSRPAAPPRWLRWLPFRRRVLPRPLSSVANPITSARWLPKAADWDEALRAAHQAVIPKLRESMERPSALYLRLLEREHANRREIGRAARRARLRRQLKGWAQMSPHLSSRDAWAAFRAIASSARPRFV